MPRWALTLITLCSPKLQLSKIKLGYELKTAKEIQIPISHLIVTGLSNLSGKTTTLESLIKRAGKKSVVFRTKIGEKSFLDSTVIPPYFKDRSDWQFVKGLIESTMKMRIRSFEQAKIIQICKTTSGNSLLEFKKKVDEKLTGKTNSFEFDIFTNLQAYLEIVLPKLQTISFSEKLELVDGLNVIDLERFSRDSEVQSLVIMSVLEEILYNFKDVIVVIPEAWKFIPQERGNPCKLIVEEFIRQGATNKNYLWIDSQDMSGVDKTPLKQISEWILGCQPEKNEAKHTFDQLPIPKSTKPEIDRIMSLGKGIFIYASRDLTTEVYVQPFWLDDERSKKIALGELKVADLDGPPLANITLKVAEKATIPMAHEPDEITKELTELRTDFFTKIVSLQQQVGSLQGDISNLKNSKPQINFDEITAKVLQKLPSTPSFNKEELVNEIISKIPQSTGSKVYEVAPLEKIQKDFLEEAKQKILADISALPDEAKKLLKYIESRGIEIKSVEIITKHWMMGVNKTQYNRASNVTQQLRAIEAVKKGNHAGYMPNLKTRITEMTSLHNATEQEIENLYQHILMELL